MADNIVVKKLFAFLPVSAYHLVYIYLAIRGFEGYSLYNLPVFS